MVNSTKMSAVLIVIFLANLSTGCCQSFNNAAPTTIIATTPFNTTTATPVTPPVCPTSKQGLKYGGEFPELPRIDVGAEAKRHGFCQLPYDLEEFHRRLKVDPDTKYNATGLISSKGYPVQDYEVATKDGFLLGMQRIPYGKNNLHLTGPRPAVLLQHGLLGCSTNWISNLANESLGFILADAGYDVWLGNVRGNTYSMKHQHLKPVEKAFWYWSWDEMAKYDLPAMVDFILNTTGHKQISYVGHSQGTTIAFAGLSISKDLQSKINLFVALAPVANASHMSSALRLLAPPQVYEPLMEALQLIHEYKFLPHYYIFDFFADTFCAHEETVILCQSIIFLFGGYSCQHMNASRVPVYISNTPAGTSLWDLQHWAQSINSERFAMFDYGCEGNVEHYGQTTPPLYRVEDIDNPIAIFSGAIDILADPADVDMLVPTIKHLLLRKEIPSYGHLDFVWAQDAYHYVYKDVVKLLSNAWKKKRFPVV